MLGKNCILNLWNSMLTLCGTGNDPTYEITGSLKNQW